MNELKQRAEAIIKNNLRIIADMQPLKKQEPWMDNLELCFTENTNLLKELTESKDNLIECFDSCQESLSELEHKLEVAEDKVEELTEREAKLVQELKDIKSMAYKTDFNNKRDILKDIIYSIQAILKELGVK